MQNLFSPPFGDEMMGVGQSGSVFGELSEERGS